MIKKQAIPVDRGAATIKQGTAVIKPSTSLARKGHFWSIRAQQRPSKALPVVDRMERIKTKTGKNKHHGWLIWIISSSYIIFESERIVDGNSSYGKVFHLLGQFLANWISKMTDWNIELEIDRVG